MSETEKQEGQKTVVAFIAGLLIGGLLVWVFSSTPDTAVLDESTDTSVKEAVENTTTKSDARTTTDSSTKTETVAKTVTEKVGDGRIEVAAQLAGPVVLLDALVFPTNAGWVVVRDYMDGLPGNILGAARYNQEEGLSPQSVNLLRRTEAEGTYQVVFFHENGDKIFDLADDVEIPGMSATFTAQ